METVVSPHLMDRIITYLKLCLCLKSICIEGRLHITLWELIFERVYIWAASF